MARKSKFAVYKTETIKRNIREGNSLVVGGRPYIHSDVDLFREGYAAIAENLKKQLQNDFKQARADFAFIATVLNKEERKLLKALGVDTVEQLNQIFLLCDNSSIGNKVFFTEVLQALRIFKQSTVEATLIRDKGEKNKELIDACTELQSALNKHAQTLLTGNAFAQTQKLLAMVTNGAKQLSIQVGNAYEEVFVAWWNELMQFLKTDEGYKIVTEAGIAIGNEIVNATMAQIGNVEQKEITTDAEARLKDATGKDITVGFTLKSGRGYNWQSGKYSDMFTGVKGYVVNKSSYKPTAPSHTKYQLPALKGNVISDTTYSLLLYVLLNYKLLSPGKAVIQETIKTVQYGLAWYHLMDEIFGSSFSAALQRGNIAGFPVFLVTLNGIYSLAAFCQSIADQSTTFTNAKNYITAYNLSRYASPSKMSRDQKEQLAKIKNEIINAQPAGYEIGLAELQQGMIDQGWVLNLIQEISNDLGYLITYRININNLMNFT